VASDPKDPFLHQLYDRIHLTPMQRKLRKLAVIPVGCVFLPWPGMSEQEARQQFRNMKQAGFTCLKQTMGTPEWPEQRTLSLALEEGLIPFWYDQGGWEDITPELLTKLGLPADMPIEQAMEHPKMIAHQTEVLQRYIERKSEKGPKPTGHDPAQTDPTWVPGVVGDVKGHELLPAHVPHFVRWLKEQYGTLEKLVQAWNFAHVGIGTPVKSWDDVEALVPRMGGNEYRRLRDVMRFRADAFIRQYISQPFEQHARRWPDEPLRAGGEMGLFLPFASRATDMEGFARVCARHGCFYPSLHLAWHFEEVNFEVARPVYMQASLAVDWAKGIWTAPIESTGGPQYFSGGKSPFVEATRHTTAGFTTDERTMTQLILSYLGAGFKGFGLWSWNARTAGWEAGEYALTDRNRNLTPRALRAGQLGQAARRWRRELWQAHKEPLVGIMVDWENEAIWAAMSVSGRDKYKTEPVRARIGASRALLNANVPWEYVTPANLRDGLGGRYRVIYLPASISIGTELQQILLDYVRQGGRLVLDMPGAYYDENGVVFGTDAGSLFEQTFGVVLHEFAYANMNTPYTLEGVELEGFTARLTPTRARVLSTYAQRPSWPGVTEAKVGQGTAVVLVCQASMNCWKPGNTALEQLLVRHTLGDYEAPFRCDGALAYRLAAPQADHYFLINDGPDRSVTLDTRQYRYQSVSDGVTGQSLVLGASIEVEGWGGRWLRLAKA